VSTPAAWAEPNVLILYTQFNQTFTDLMQQAEALAGKLVQAKICPES